MDKAVPLKTGRCRDLFGETVHRRAGSWVVHLQHETDGGPSLVLEGA